MNSTNEGLVEPRAFGPAHMRVIELRLAEVHVDWSFNCRGPYTEEEIADAAAVFGSSPMLHPPAVARVDGEWKLIAGFLRFAVWRTQELEVGLFRWLEEEDSDALQLTNLAENVMRRDLRAWELVEAVTRLRERGFDASVIGQHCGFSARWVRRLYKLKRDAHPELWAKFVEGTSPHLTITRMLDLADHPLEEQLQRWEGTRDSAERADEQARGYRTDSTELRSRPGQSRPRGRRRYPPRRHARQVRRLLKEEPSLDPVYRKGVIDALDWLLDGKELPVKVSVSSAARRRVPGDAAIAVPDGEER